VLKKVSVNIDDGYAESVMIHSLSPDGSVDLSIRLARFPLKNTAHVWIHLATTEGAWSVVDESFQLNGEPLTAVDKDTAEFAAHSSSGEQSLSFKSSARHSSSMKGNASGNTLLGNTRHPEVGIGAIAASYDINFEAGSMGFHSNNGRWELTGIVSGNISIGSKNWGITHQGKWHRYRDTALVGSY